MQTSQGVSLFTAYVIGARDQSLFYCCSREQAVEVASGDLSRNRGHVIRASDRSISIPYFSSKQCKYRFLTKDRESLKSTVIKQIYILK